MLKPDLVVIIRMGVIMDSTEDESPRWHAAGLSNRVKRLRKTQTPIHLTLSAARSLLLKLNKLKVAAGPTLVWVSGSWR